MRAAPSRFVASVFPSGPSHENFGLGVGNCH
jgi:hypothetical protein